ncbi:MAG: hypothetical protein FLDDKLPJ_02872 [Phycisphaerae bacterium]|nr:hypothetical protein [Phycisphaerae bacterium]
MTQYAIHARRLLLATLTVVALSASCRKSPDSAPPDAPQVSPPAQSAPGAKADDASANPDAPSAPVPPSSVDPAPGDSASELKPGAPAPPAPAPPTPDPTREALLAAPLSVAVEGVTLRLEAFLWRDFMPISPPGGKPLMASIKLVVVDAGAKSFPGGVDAERVWLVKGEEVWAGKFLVEERPDEPGMKEKVFRDGPAWEPGEEVDVVIEVHDRAGAKRLLRAPKVRIIKTS